ncbi:MAG: hypothetical protein R3F11_06465 [Verrucomicrobiales bacterium]
MFPEGGPEIRFLNGELRGGGADQAKAYDAGTGFQRPERRVRADYPPAAINARARSSDLPAAPPRRRARLLPDTCGASRQPTPAASATARAATAAVAVRAAAGCAAAAPRHRARRQRRFIHSGGGGGWGGGR